MSGKIIFKFKISLLLSIISAGLIPIFLVITLFAIIFPFLSTIFDLNSDFEDKFFFKFISRLLKKIIFDEYKMNTIKKAKNMKAILLKETFKFDKFFLYLKPVIFSSNINLLSLFIT